MKLSNDKPGQYLDVHLSVYLLWDIMFHPLRKNKIKKIYWFHVDKKAEIIK